MQFGRLAAAAIAAAFAVAAVTPGAARAEDTKLTVMAFIGIQNLPIWAAQSQGFFAKRGLSVDLKVAPGSEVLRQGLADGKWQIGHAAFDNAVAMATSPRSTSSAASAATTALIT